MTYNSPLSFVVRSPLNKPDVVEVRYDCACGCKPRARYQRGADDAGHEHCCCGNVHFVGSKAEDRLKGYLEERLAQGQDSDVGGYTTYAVQVTAPWGERVPVAYAIPHRPRTH
jgi:hypothetical protein